MQQVGSIKQSDSTGSSRDEPSVEKGGPEMETFDIVSALDGLEARLTEGRNQLHRAVLDVRQTRDRLIKQRMLLAQASVTGEGFELLQRATDILEEFARQFVTLASVPEGLRPAPPMGISPITPVVPRGGKRSKKATRRQKSSATKPDKGSHQLSITEPAAGILRAALSTTVLPDTIEHVLEIAYGASWKDTPIRVMRGRGNMSLVPLGEEIGRGQDSQVLKTLRNSVGKVRLLRLDQVPEGFKPTATVRHLAELMGVYPQDTVECALKAWGIDGQEP